VCDFAHPRVRMRETQQETARAASYGVRERRSGGVERGA